MDLEKREFQYKVEDAASCSGSGTELVTVWIPPGKNLNTVRSRLQGERSEAENIKSKKTRDRVTGALERTLNILHKYDTVPENGLVVCCGYVDTVDEYVSFEFDDLPQPIRDSKYECSDEFEVEQLWEMAFGGSEWWGLITVTRDSASIGRYTTQQSGHVDVIDTFESQVMGKSQAGGQSQTRFERLREEQREEHYKKVVDIAKRNFDSDNENFKGLAIGGPNVTVSSFREWLPSSLQQEIVTIETVDHAGSEESLTALAQEAEGAFEELESIAERALVKEAKRRLRDNDRVAYGHGEVSKAIGYGAVDTLLVSADYATHFIKDISSDVEGQGGSVEVISTMHEEGEQLDRVFDGLVALLRFDIE